MKIPIDPKLAVEALTREQHEIYQLVAGLPRFVTFVGNWVFKDE